MLAFCFRLATLISIGLSDMSLKALHLHVAADGKVSWDPLKTQVILTRGKSIEKASGSSSRQNLWN